MCRQHRAGTKIYAMALCLASTPPPAHANALAVLRPRRSTTRRQRHAGLGFSLAFFPQPSPTSPAPPSTRNMCVSTCAIPYHPSRADVSPPSTLLCAFYCRQYDRRGKGASPKVNGAATARRHCRLQLRRGITAPDEGHGEADKPQHHTLLTVAGPPAHSRASLDLGGFAVDGGAEAEE
ncbi:hypothetical protein GGX14DRAFT_578340 [Mycena pura]|uniref:Uncharacterized protein n=1 Tax=Mycena pura TaxID=153505 RepID=A0AAD6XZK3_9AGAR|nr:hypothetical protein GGX14DRAFT_578340 [Mycena pura]